MVLVVVGGGEECEKKGGSWHVQIATGRDSKEAGLQANPPSLDACVWGAEAERKEKAGRRSGVKSLGGV